MKNYKKYLVFFLILLILFSIVKFKFFIPKIKTNSNGGERRINQKSKIPQSYDIIIDTNTKEYYLAHKLINVAWQRDDWNLKYVFRENHMLNMMITEDYFEVFYWNLSDSAQSITIKYNIGNEVIRGIKYDELSKNILLIDSFKYSDGTIKTKKWHLIKQ